MTPRELHDLATSLAREAGTMALAGRRRGLTDVATKSTLTDMVTEYDRASEKLIVDALRTKRPSDAIVGEEGSSVDGSSGITWCIDPIDGTTNFAHGIPIFCSSLALEIDGVAQVAAVYDPTRRELFTAERGGGAFLNGKPMKVSAADTLLEAVLVTGFPYDVHSRVAEIVGLFGEFVGRARAVRRLGSAAIDLCYVAAGWMDGFWERDLNAWDIAAGALLVEEAGGTISNFKGEPFASRGRDVLASNGTIHQAMLDVIAGRTA